MNSKQEKNNLFTENKPTSPIVQEISLHSQSKPNKNPTILNPFLQAKQINLSNPFQNSVHQQNKEVKLNKTQLLVNTPSIIQNQNKNNSNENSSGVIKIKIYKSHVKPHRTEMQQDGIGESAKLKLEQKIDSKNEKITTTAQFTPQVPQTPTPIIIEQTMISKSNEYKMLIKKIAMQLKKKIRPRTRGYFYQKVFRNEKYMNIVKKIANNIKIKLGLHPPTNGAFYTFVKKEEEIKLKKIKEKKYKLLIKKISSQLKKRVKLPTCKIIKIYESYIVLIKRLAQALKKSLKNSISNTTTNNTNINIEQTNNNNGINEQSMDIEPANCDCENDKRVNQNKDENIINNNAIEEIKEEKMDIEVTKEEGNLDANINDINHQIARTEEKKEYLIDKNEIKALSCGNNSRWISSQKKTDNNQVDNYTFSKMEVIDNELPITTSPKKHPEINSENPNPNNEQEKMIISENQPLIQDNKAKEENTMIMNDNNTTNDLIKNEEIKCEEKENANNIIIDDIEDKKEEEKVNTIIEKKENTEKAQKMQIEKENQKEKENIKEKERDISKCIKLSSKSAKSKSIFFKFTLMKKNELFNIDNNNDNRKIANKSHTKREVKLNLENLHQILETIPNKEKKEENEESKEEIKDENTNLSLQDIEITKSNFVNKFKNFLEQENIQIINDVPVSTNEKNILYFQQSNFWYLIMSYLFYTNNNLSLYNIIYLLELYISWAQDLNSEIFYSIKEKTKEYIFSNISKDVLEQFLFMNKLDNVDKIFEKIELSVKISEKKNLRENFKTVKLDDINYICDEKDKKCKCYLCMNDEACIKKVCDLNKNKMEIVNNSSIDIMKKEFNPEQLKQSLIKKNNSTIVFHNNEELFYKGDSAKKNNTIFSKSKTILEDNGNFQFLHLPKESPLPKGDKNEKKLIESIDINLGKEDISEVKDIDKKDEIVTNEFSQQELDNNMDMEDSSPKNFKNISKSATKEKDEKEEKNSKDEKEKEEKEEKNLIEEKVVKESKEEEESSEEDTKNLKKEKKSRKGRSRKNNKKKKDTTKFKEAKDKDKEDQQEDKSVQKKRKSTNQKNKSKLCAKNDDDEEKENTNESEEIILGTRSAHKFEQTTTNNNSKRKKSKTPNKKKTKKH